MSETFGEYLIGLIEQGFEFAMWEPKDCYKCIMLRLGFRDELTFRKLDHKSFLGSLLTRDQIMRLEVEQMYMELSK